MKRLLLLLLLVPSVFAAEQFVWHNESETPLNASVNYTILAPSDAGIVFRLINRSSELDVSFPAGVRMPVNQTAMNVSFNYSLPLLVIAQNRTYFAEWEVWNDANNATAPLFLRVNVVNDVEPIIENVTENVSWVIATGGYAFNITQNFLPGSGTVTFELHGPTGEVVNVTACGEWLECIEPFAFNSLNKSYLDVKYTVPWNTSIGTYERIVGLRVGNTSRETSIVFTIKEPTITFQTWEWDEDCFNGTTLSAVRINIQRCLNEYERWSARRMAESLSMFLNQSECTNTTIYEDQYVVVGNVTKQVHDAWQTCQSEKSDTQRELMSCSGNLDMCNAEKNSWKEDYLNQSGTLQNAVLQAKAKLIVENEEIREAADRKQRLTILWIIGILAGLCTVGFVFYRYRKENLGVAW